MTARKNTNATNDNIDNESSTVADGTDGDSVSNTDYVDQYSCQITNTEDNPVDSKILAETDLTTTTVSALLDDSRYLVMIKHLAKFDNKEGQSDGISMGSLVDRVAATENGITQLELTAAHRQSVWMSLCETHLPLLDEAGIVHWESKWHCIRPRQSVHILSTLLDVENDFVDEDLNQS